MTFIRPIAIFLLLLSLSSFCGAQSISISGIIQDAHTKEPVQYASVYFQKSGFGKTSDTSGAFSFHLNNLVNDTLVVSYIGYDLYKIPVSASNDNKPISIQLERGGLHNVVVVKTKFNKGLYLWKKIMSRKKQYNRYNLANFGYEAHNKLEIDLKNFQSNKLLKGIILKPFGFILNNVDSSSEKEPFLPAYLIENISDYAFQKNPEKRMENLKASKIPSYENENFSKLTGVMDQNVNIYNNFVNVMDRDFISPFNDNGDAYYTFTVPDTMIVNGKKLFHFVFNPKRPGQNTFNGDAWVTEKTFMIQKISMYLGKEANINFIDRVSIFQEFIPINDSVIFLSRDKFFADFRVMGKKTLTLIGRKTTSYKNIVINSDSLTALFAKQNTQEMVKAEKDIFQKTDSAWKQMRHDTLSTNEKAIYATVDKLMALPKFQRLQRTLRFLGTGYKDIGNFEIGPWFNWISADSLQGTRFRFDLGTNTGFNKNIYLHGYLAYGLRDRKFKGQAEVFWILKRDPNRIRLHASYTDDIDYGISQIGEVSQDNIFSLAIRKPNNYRKFIQVKDMRFEVFNEWGKGFSTEWFFAHRQFDPLRNLPDKSNFPVNTGSSLTNFEIALKLRWAYLEKFFETDYFRTSLGTKYPIVELTLSKGIPGVMKSAYDYTKLNLLVKDFAKISPYGTLRYRVYAGKIFGTIPYPFLENHPGNDLYYYNTNSFSLMNRFEYISDQYAGVNLEHNIGSGLFRFIPLTRKLKWRQFWTVKTVIGSLSSGNTALNNAAGNFKTLNGKPYMELGTGIDNIFRILRVDFVWRVLPTPLPSNRSSRFGIFGSFQFQF
ncbi:MAG: carboxypeptidase-like regulatory domain-containing protein [Chitinophagaceae bacterium]|nr:carboxypeptidase-like regulatory domain-containing protein [Chitinophagaceae bacterium]